MHNEAQFNAASLVAAQYCECQPTAAGLDADALHRTRIPATALKAAGFTGTQLRLTAGYEAAQLLSAGFSVAQLPSPCIRICRPAAEGLLMQRLFSRSRWF
jgi:hypothetical protein